MCLKNAKREKTALFNYNSERRCWIYIIIDPNTKKIIYVGRTMNLKRRAASHDYKSSQCHLLRKYLQKHNFTVTGNMFVISELPEGVPFTRGYEFETLFINDKKTIWSEERPWGCNQKHGDHLASLDLDALRREVNEGIRWPATMAAPLRDAVAREAVLEDLEEMVGDLDPAVSAALVLAREQRKHLERSLMTPLAMCESIAAEYEARPHYETADRDLVTRDLNLLKGKLEEDVEERDEAMLGLVKAELLFVKPQRACNIPTYVIALGFRRLAGALETREVDRMEASTVLTKILKVRAWAFSHGMRKPSQQAARKKKKKDGESAEDLMKETALGMFLRNWKGRRYYTDHRVPECDLIMRNVPWWRDHCDVSNAEKKADLEASLAAMLEQGFGMHEEPEFEGKRVLKKTEHRQEYTKLHNLKAGQYDEETIDRVLAPLPASRRAFYKPANWHEVRRAYLEKLKISGAERTKRGHANGVQKQKPRKRARKDEEDNEDDEEEDEDKNGGASTSASASKADEDESEEESE